MSNAQQTQRSQILSRYHRDTERPLEPNNKNVRSTKPKARPFQKTEAAPLQGKKVRNVYTKVYDVHNKVFSYHIGQFPTRSKRGNKYIMVMVGKDKIAILVDHIKNRIDA